MTQADKQAIVDAMMSGVPDEAHVQKEMAELAWGDLERIAPVIEGMLAQAEARGRLQGILETLAGQKERRKEIAASVPF
jgi:hypothetical protein